MCRIYLKKQKKKPKKKASGGRKQPIHQYSTPLTSLELASFEVWQSVNFNVLFQLTGCKLVTLSRLRLCKRIVSYFLAKGLERCFPAQILRAVWQQLEGSLVSSSDRDIATSCICQCSPAPGGFISTAVWKWTLCGGIAVRISIQHGSLHEKRLWFPPWKK